MFGSLLLQNLENCSVVFLSQTMHSNICMSLAAAAVWRDTFIPKNCSSFLQCRSSSNPSAAAVRQQTSGLHRIPPDEAGVCGSLERREGSRD